MAARIGVDESTLREAEEHLWVMKQYPELRRMSRSAAVEAAELLEWMSEEERRERLALLAGGQEWTAAERREDRERLLRAFRAKTQARVKEWARERAEAEAQRKALLPKPSPIPVEEARRIAWRGEFQRWEQTTKALLDRPPGGVRQALFPDDLPGARAFLDRLHQWLQEFERELNNTS